MKHGTSGSHVVPEVDKSPAGVGIIRESGALHAADAVLHALTKPWGSPEVWWSRIASQTPLPPVTRCPQCGMGQRLGRIEQTLVPPSATGEIIHAIEFTGHPHLLSNAIPGDLVVVRDITRERSHTLKVQEKLSQYHAICDQMDEVFFRMDPTGLIQVISPSVHKLLKQRPGDLQGKPFADLCVTPDHFQELMQILKTSDRIEDFDLILTCRRGKQAPVSLSAQVERDDSGERIAIQGIFRDAMERTRLDAMLMERTRRFHETIHRLERQQHALDQHLLMSITDPEGTILHVNSKWTQVSRYELEEILGKNHKMFDSGYHPKSFFKEMWRTIQGGRTWRGEIRNRAKNGEFFWLDCAIVPFLTPAGRPFQYISVASDITERSRNTARLEENLLFLRHVIDSMGEGAYVLDNRGQLLMLNQEGERLLGWKESEILHRNLHEIIHHTRPDKTPFSIRDCPAHQSLLGRTYRVDEDHFIRRDGTFLPVSHVTSPLLREGEIVGSMAIFRNATVPLEEIQQIKRSRDAAVESARLKSVFLANMSHEIRTPMNAIVGMNDLLMDTPLNDEQQEFAEIVRDSSRSLLALINDILDFSKIEAGKIDIERIDFSLLTVVEGAAELLAPQAHDKGISLMTHVSTEIPRGLHGDPGRLRQMLLNLLGNAIKFTEDGEVTLRVRMEELSGNQVTVHFAVADTGIGLKQGDEETNRLFEPFTQAERGTARKFGGTGLGLAISKRLAELMGGEIGARSRPEGGTIFWFRLPFQLARQPVSDDFDGQPVDLLPGMRILTVMERTTDQEILGACFDSCEMFHHGTINGEQGLVAFREAMSRKEPFRIVVISASLSDMDCQILADLLRREADTQPLTLIVLMDWDDKEERARFLKSGFDGVLVKPMRRAEWIRLLVEQIQPDSAPKPPEAITVTPSRETRTPEPDAYDALESGNLLLLVEDNLVNQRVALLQLKKLGYAAHAVSNGQEAVEAVSHLPYALVLMDCQMPVMDGFEATHAIRKLEQSTARHIPIIAMTAHAMKGDRERCLNAGMDDYLSKPVSPETLKQKLQYWIPKSIGAPPPVEISQLRQLFGDDDEMIRELLHHFRPSARELLDKLAEMIQKEDGEQVREASMELKEACSNMGVSAMAHLVRVMEQATRGLEWEETRHTLAHLESAFKNVESFIDTF
ncbi:Sensor histidine kinase RcsC [Candidatus Magnetaquicoccaceae bacterium FCR-1]|uniref:histidine kinase n=1 Tax=Candidatus Magnetaquiglobus chichijimensis TaxID=3141448 RepID=A0ABQ0C9U1_9PROT